MNSRPPSMRKRITQLFKQYPLVGGALIGVGIGLLVVGSIIATVATLGAAAPTLGISLSAMVSFLGSVGITVLAGSSIIALSSFITGITFSLKQWFDQSNSKRAQSNIPPADVNIAAVQPLVNDTTALLQDNLSATTSITAVAPQAPQILSLEEEDEKNEAQHINFSMLSKKGRMECYESKFQGNTELHDAIHKNDTAKALKLVSEASDTIINISAMGNTPLLFALKKGNIAVANTILNERKAAVNIHAKDTRGLTALHWACMLRLHEAIGKLLDLGADPHDVVQPWAEADISQYHEMSPYHLYCRDISLISFTNYLSADYESERNGLAVDDPYCLTFFGNKSPRKENKMPGFAERVGNSALLNIPGEMAYTDIIFHMRELCINLKWINEKRKFEFFTHGYGDRKLNRTIDVFRTNFGLGVTDFCNFRNAVPLDNKLIEKMATKGISPSKSL